MYKHVKLPKYFYLLMIENPWRYCTFVPPLLLLMTHHEKTQLKAFRSPNPNPWEGTKVQLAPNPLLGCYFHVQSPHYQAAQCATIKHLFLHSQGSRPGLRKPKTGISINTNHSYHQDSYLPHVPYAQV